MNIADLLKKLPESELKRIHSEMQESMFSQMLRIPKTQNSSRGFSVAPKKGTVDLLSPSGELLMRDEKVIEKTVEIKYEKRWVRR